VRDISAVVLPNTSATDPTRQGCAYSRALCFFEIDLLVEGRLLDFDRAGQTIKVQ
jgi:hypothetical protein